MFYTLKNVRLKFLLFSKPFSSYVPSKGILLLNNLFFVNFAVKNYVDEGDYCICSKGSRDLKALLSCAVLFSKRYVMVLFKKVTYVYRKIRRLIFIRMRSRFFQQDAS